MTKSLQLQQWTRRTGSLFSLLLLLSTSHVSAQVFTWNVDADGQWTTNTNWTPNTGNPNAAGATANFFNAITADHVVTINTDRTVGTLHFDAADNYTLLQSGGGTDLILNNSGSGALVTATNANGNGAHTIDVDLILQDSVTFNNDSTGILNIAEGISSVGTQAITITGSETVRFSAGSNFTGDVTIDGGTLSINGNNRLGNNANDVFIDGGVLESFGGGNLNFNAGRVFTIEAGGATFRTNTRTQTYNDAGQITGSGTLTKDGTGTMIVSAAMTGFSGDVEIDAGLLRIGNDNALGTGGVSGSLSLNNSGAALGTQDNIGLRILGDYSDVAGASLRPGDSDGPLTDVFNDGIHFANNQTNTVNADVRGLDNTNDDFALGADGASTVVNFNGTWDGDGGNVSSYMVVQNGGRINVTSSATIDSEIGAGNSRPFHIVGDGDPSIVEFEEGFQAVQGANVELASVRLSNARWITNSNGNLNGFIIFQDIAGGVWNTATNDQTFAGAVTFSVAGEIDNDTNLTLNGVVGGGGAITKSGTETLTLTNAGNSFTSTFTIEEGILRAEATGATGTSTFNNVVEDGATFQLANNITITEGDIDISGDGTTGSNGAINNATGNNTLASSLDVQNDASIVSDAGTLTVTGQIQGGSNVITVDGDGAVTFTNQFNSTDTLLIRGDGTKTFSGSQINGTGTSLVDVDGAGDHVITSTLNITDYTQAGTGTVTMNGAGSNNINGTATVNAGTLILDKSSGHAVSDLVIGNGVTTGTVRLDGDNQIQDFNSVIIDEGSTLDLNGNDDAIGTLTMTAGTVTTAVGTLTIQQSGAGAVTTNASATSSTISGNLNLSGFQPEFTVADGAATDDLLVSAAVTGASGFSKDGDGQMTITENNAGLSGAIVINGGTVSSTETGSISLGGTTGATAPLGTGTITVNDGSLNVTSTGSDVFLENTLTINGGTSTLTSGDDVDFLGNTMNVNSGTINLVARDDVTTRGTTTTWNVGNTGNINIEASQPNANWGSGGSNPEWLIGQNTTINMTGAGTITATTPAANLAGDITWDTQSTIRVNNGVDFSAPPNEVISDTTLTSTANFTGGGTLIVEGNLTQNGASFAQNGSGKSNVTMTPTSATTVALDGSAALGSATVASERLDTFTKTGAGTVRVDTTLNADSIVIDQGTLLLGADNRIGSDVGATFGNVTLDGGTLNSGGFSDSMGTLTLTDDSSLDLGSGASVISFADSSGTSWSGGDTLSILNWSGSTTGGGTDQVIFGIAPSGLTSGQLAQISFINPAGFAPGTYQAQFVAGTGEIVPLIPEPEVWAAALGLLGFALFGEIRRRRNKAQQ